MSGAVNLFPLRYWLLAVFCFPPVLLRAETVATVNEPSGSIQVQIQDVQPNVKYHVGFWELGADKPTAVLPVSVPAQLSFASVRWEKPAEGIYLARIQRNSEWLPIVQPAPITLPELGFTVLSGSMQRQSGRTQFVLPSAGLFRVLAMTENAMHAAHIRSWHLGGAAQNYSVDWDYWDDHKTRNHAQTPGLLVIMDFIPLPPGYIVVGFPPYERYRSAGLNRNVAIPEDRIEARIVLPASAKPVASAPTRPATASDAGLPVLRAGDPVRVELSAESLRSLGQRRYEVIYFLNGEYIHEEAKGVSPTTYRLPSIPRLQGPAFLTVNIRDFLGNVGSATVKILYQPAVQ